MAATRVLNFRESSGHPSDKFLDPLLVWHFIYHLITKYRSSITVPKVMIFMKLEVINDMMFFMGDN